jgi:hypothetical protein
MKFIKYPVEFTQYVTIERALMHFNYKSNLRDYRACWRFGKQGSNNTTDRHEKLDLNRFKVSCNSYNAGGDLSRNTFENRKGLSNFMTLDEGFSFLWFLVPIYLHIHE